MAMPFKERRAFKRVGSNASLTFVLEREPSKRHGATAKNLSLNSVCFETKISLAVEEKLRVELSTIFGPVEVAAVVVRTTGAEVVCRFVDVTPDAAAKIKNWLFPPFEP